MEPKAEVLEFKIKVDAETAATDVQVWLDYKRVKPSIRNAYAGNINKMVECIMYGDLVINKDFTITHQLNIPIVDKDNTVVRDKFMYAARLNGAQINSCVQHAEPGDIGLTLAYGAALTGDNSNIIAKMDSCDIAILAAIAVFFTQ